VLIFMSLMAKIQ